MMNITKIWPIATASLIAFTGIASAEDEVWKDGEGPDIEIFPAVYPTRKCSAWNVNVAGFYWNAKEDGLGMAIENKNRLDNPTYLNDAEVENLDFKYDFGGRFGVGYTFEHDGWDLALSWTTFHTKAKEDESEDCGDDSDDFFIPTYSAISSPCNNCMPPTACGTTGAGPQPTLSVSSLDARWKLELNYIDLDLGRKFCATPWFQMRPFIGLRGIWIDQDYDIEYRGGSVDDLAGDYFGCGATAEDQVDLDLDFKGVGVRAGLNNQWNIGCGWSIFGDFALAMIYGRISTSFEEHLVRDCEKIDIAELEDHFHASRYVTDLQLGVRYEHVFGECDNFRFTASLGWEHHGFLNMNHFYRLQHINDGGGEASESMIKTTFGDEDQGEYIINREHGDLTTQGWTLTGRLDF